MMSRTYTNMKFFTLTLVTAASCLLGGCSLAKTENETSTFTDLLVGAYVIPHEFNDSFDISGFTSEPNGNKIYADIDKHGSDYSADWTYSFPQLNGYMLLMARGYDENQESVEINLTDPEFSDLAYSSDITDEKTVNGVSGTIYYTLDNNSASEEAVMADESTDINASDGAEEIDDPVYDYDEYYLYEESDGDIYLIADNYNINAVGPASGNPSTTYRASTTTTENGESVTEERVITISFKKESLPQQTQVLQMSANHEVLEERSIDFNNIPESMKAANDMAYIIVESSHQNSEGVTITDRQIYNKDEADTENTLDLNIYSPEDFGILRCDVIEVGI